MRDGVRLATDIYRPSRPDGSPESGPMPAILVRTSYDKSSPQMVIEPVARFFTRHGYAVVLQDLRGRGISEGTGQYFHIANPAEGPDGCDTIEWIAAQDWCDGGVGMVGSSHLGIVQNVAALYRPPHLKAIWADVAPTKAIEGCCREGGAMALHMYGAMFLHGYDAQELADDPAGRRRIEQAAEDMRAQIQYPPQPGVTALAHIPSLERTVLRYCRDGVYDHFWAMDVLDQRARFERFADIPVTLSSGWYDPFAADAAGQFVALSRQNRSPTHLILGPWNHGGMRSGRSYFGEVEFGPEAAWGTEIYNRERLRWFDRWLRRRPTGVEDDPPVRLFVMGGGTGRRTPEGRLDHGGHWRSEAAWPPAAAREVTWHLTAEGGLAADAPKEAIRCWTHDPEHPVPTIGAAVTGFLEWMKVPEGFDAAYLPPRARMHSIIEDGPMHQRERPDLVGARAPFPLLAKRPDVLVFQTDVLQRPVEVIGQAVAELHVMSSAHDTDITVKLIDVHPPSPDFPEGFHMNLADTILRGRFRNGLAREEMMIPGEVHLFRITLPPVANLFAAGHRIRLDVASSNFPRFDVNPGTGEKLGLHTRMVRAYNTLHFGGATPSRLTLPVVAG
jgi:putative CocE/NonD family hydrolase